MVGPKTFPTYGTRRILGLGWALLALLLSATVSRAQEPSSQSKISEAPSPATKPEPQKSEREKKVPTRVEDDALLTRLQLLITKRALAEANFKLLAAEAQKTQNEFEALTRNFNTQIDTLYAKLGLKRSDYDINLETGEITPVKKE